MRYPIRLPSSYEGWELREHDGPVSWVPVSVCTFLSVHLCTPVSPTVCTYVCVTPRPVPVSVLRSTGVYVCLRLTCVYTHPTPSHPTPSRVRVGGTGATLGDRGRRVPVPRGGGAVRRVGTTTRVGGRTTRRRGGRPHLPGPPGVHIRSPPGPHPYPSSGLTNRWGPRGLTTSSSLIPICGFS